MRKLASLIIHGVLQVICASLHCKIKCICNLGINEKLLVYQLLCPHKVLLPVEVSEAITLLDQWVPSRPSLVVGQDHSLSCASTKEHFHQQGEVT